MSQLRFFVAPFLMLSCVTAWAAGPVVTVRINDGAASTTSRRATIVMQDTGTGTTAQQMRFSLDAETWTDWETFAASKFWLMPDTAPASSATYRLYGEFKDAAGVTGAADTSITLIRPLALSPAIPVQIVSDGQPATIALASHFRDPVYERARLASVLGNIDITLYAADTPGTVANFLNYVATGAYIETFIHRSLAGFVIQGGGFRFLPGTASYEEVPANAPITNEFGYANVRGTIAMAKLPDNPDSATTQWFFNLGDNSANLDNQNGGFTVFGAADTAAMDVVDDIAALPVWNASSIDSAWDNLPLDGYSTSVALSKSHFVILNTISRQPDALTFSMTNSRPDLVAVSLANGVLQVAPAAAGVVGTTRVTVKAQAPDGRELTQVLAATAKLPAMPALTLVHLASNSPRGVAVAVAGDTLTLTLATDKAIQTPTVTLAGYAVTAVQGADAQHWSAPWTVPPAAAAGPVTLQVNCRDLAGTAGVPATETTDGSSVTIDRTTITAPAGDVMQPHVLEGDTQSYAVTVYVPTGVTFTCAWARSQDGGATWTPLAATGTEATFPPLPYTLVTHPAFTLSGQILTRALVTDSLGVVIKRTWTVQAVYDRNRLPAPGALTAAVTPAQPTTTDYLLCTLAGTDTVTDPDAEDLRVGLSYLYTWTNGVTAVVHGPTRETTDSLAPAPQRLAQSWLCRVAVVDQTGGVSATSAASNAVTPGNNVPVATPLALTRHQGVDATVSVTLSASDTEAAAGLQALTFAKASDPVHGTVTVSPDGTMVYTATDPASTDADSFTFTVADGFDTSAPATVTISVNTDPVDTEPDAFAFASTAGAKPGAAVVSGPVVITGINAAAAISVTGGESAVSTDGGATWSTFSATVPATVTSGTRVRLRTMAPAEFATPAEVQLTVGSVTGTWHVTTHTASPAVLLSLNGGAASTTSRRAILTLTDTGAGTAPQDMRFSFDGQSWGDWQPFAAAATLLLPDPAPAVSQAVTLHAEFRDAAGALDNAAADCLLDRALQLTHTVPAQTVWHGHAAEIDLTALFADPAYERVAFAGVLGTINATLYAADTPGTVANFLSYVDSGAYASTFIHRSMPGFVVQGGGYQFLGPATYDAVVAAAPIVNEFGYSNRRGTLAMAKLPDNPDSATCEWFFNLADNSANLDNQNGGFTVFGSADSDSLPAVDAIAALPVLDSATEYGLPWTDLPVSNYSAATGLSRDNCVVFPGIYRLPDALTFTATSAQPATVTARLSNGVLRLTAGTAGAGVATVTVRATAPDGRAREVSISVTTLAQMTLDLAPGWNLVSLPLLPDVGAAAAAIFQKPTGGSAISGDPWLWDHRGHYAQVTALAPGTGYLVHAPEAVTLVLTGTPLQTPVAGLGLGWNLIGLPAESAIPADSRLLNTWWGTGRGGALARQTTALPACRAYWVHALEPLPNPLW